MVVLLALFMALIVPFDRVNAQEITIVNGGYEGVIVAIGSDLDEAKCATYVNKTKAMIDSASVLLHAATGTRVSFSKVTILLPATWYTCGEAAIPPATKLTHEDAHIRIHGSHPIFVDNPWTEQPRGCGDPGNFMYFSNNFIADVNNMLGSASSVFVHEWAKFRWGVFEEYGHHKDSVYPAAFRNGSEWVPNYCTNGEVEGEFNSCEPQTTEAECSFTPSAVQRGNATSSLLAAPFIDSIDTFCTKENHISGAPTKHNLMCDKQSTWDVISKHPDITDTLVGRAVANTTYIIQKMAQSKSQDKTVFVLDISKQMGAKSRRWQYLRESVYQFIMEKAASGSQVGIVLFANSVTNTSLQTLSTAEDRKSLASILPFGVTNSITKNVSLGIETAEKLLLGSGLIVLIVENTQTNTVGTPANLVTAANGLAVQPILYPASSTISTDLYKPVAGLHGFTPLSIEDKNSTAGSNAQDTENLFTLSHYIQNVVKTAVQEVVSGNCIPEPSECNISLTVGNYSSFESDFIIEVLQDPRFLSKIIIGPPDSGVSISSAVNTSLIYKGTKLQDDVYTVSAQTDSLPVIIRAILSAFGLQNSSQLSIDVSASKSLDSLVYTTETAPVLYAKLTYGSKSVVYAKVIATIRSFYSNGSIKVSTLKLLDNGLGGDVTGSDGIYSAYLLGITELGKVSISITANDNNGSARYIGEIAYRTAPVNPVVLTRACCGSSLDLSGLTLENPGAFTVTTPPGINAKTSGDVTANYPPSRITDLAAVREGLSVTLTFTASGEDFNVGQATSYTIDYGINLNKTFNSTGPAGIVETTNIQINYDTRYVFTVKAVDSAGQSSKPSNEVRVFIARADVVDPAQPLKAGAIAGIVIGCIFLVIILLIIIYLCCHRDNLGENWLWKYLTCQCCKKEDSSRHLGRSRTGKSDIIRTNITGPIRPSQEVYGNNVDSGAPSSGPMRDVEDLYRKPDMEAKWNSRKGKMSDSDDDGGFGNSHRQQYPNQRDNMRMKDLASRNYASHPINQLGIHPANQYQPSSRGSLSSHDNYGYSDTEQYGTGNRRPTVPPRKPVTQV